MGVSGQEFRVDLWALGSQNGCKQGVTRLQQEVTGQAEKHTGAGTKGSQVKVMKMKPQPSAVNLNSETKARITVGRLSLPLEKSIFQVHVSPLLLLLLLAELLPF